MLATVKVRPGNHTVSVDVGAAADLDGACARPPEKSMAGAEECLRRGRTKEWEEDGAQKKLT